MSISDQSDDRRLISDVERAQIKPVAEHWKQVLLSTIAMDPDDDAAFKAAAAELYALQGLKQPLRFIKVPSPLAGSVAAGLGAAAWWLSDGGKIPASGTLSYEIIQEIKDSFAWPDLTKDMDRSFFIDFEARGTVRTFRTQTLEAFDQLHWDNVLGAAYEKPIDAMRDANVRFCWPARPELGPPPAHIEHGDAIAEGIRAARLAIGEPHGQTPWARQWDIFQTCEEHSFAPDTSGMNFEQIVKAFDAARYVIEPWRRTWTGRQPTFEPMDWLDWAEPHALQERLGRKLGWVTHKILVGMASRGIREWYHDRETRALGPLDFAERVRGLPLSDRVKNAMTATRHGGLRWMHERFCIVSDRPCELNVDDQGRPHGQNGPSHRWSDGFALYHWHGVAIPADFVQSRLGPTDEQLEQCDSEDVSLAGLEIQLERRETCTTDA